MPQYLEATNRKLEHHSSMKSLGKGDRVNVCFPGNGTVRIAKRLVHSLYFDRENLAHVYKCCPIKGARWSSILVVGEHFQVFLMASLSGCCRLLQDSCFLA